MAANSKLVKAVSIVNDALTALTSFEFAAKSSYSVRIEVTDSGGESFQEAFTIEVEEQVVAGLEPDPQSITSLYPNPGTDYVNIEFTSQNFPFDLKLYNMKGEMKTHAPEVTSNSIRLDVRNMTKGIYLVMVQNSLGGITRKKLIITR